MDESKSKAGLELSELIKKWFKSSSNTNPKRGVYK